MNSKIVMTAIALLAVLGSLAQPVRVASPDGKVAVTISEDCGCPYYTVDYDGRTVMPRSSLGFKANIGDFSQKMTLRSSHSGVIDRTYEMTRTKASRVHEVANTMDVTFENADGYPMTVTFRVGDHDIAFRYSLPRGKDDRPKCAVIHEETTAFNFPEATTTFLSPQIQPMTGWERTKPSYEEDYTADAPLATPSRFGEGYTFPCLFRIYAQAGEQSSKPVANQVPNASSCTQENVWVLVGETGVGGNYVGSHLSDYRAGSGYTIAFPNPGELNGQGTSGATMALPGCTPWRTITVGNSLKPIVETTIAYDPVEPRYEPTRVYRPGRYTWSWLIWQDESIVWDDQVAFIDLAATMGYEYVLVDNWWDQKIGRDRMAYLSRYAQAKGVRLLLWYNSNGSWNDAPQTPRDCMNTAIAREREMAWLENIGVAGIKVDFFGSDKQPMMQLYEDILADANRHGLQVIFHGCTMPRGWERMYPNYVASEAVLASENVFFDERHARLEGFELTIHPFCRNALGSMDWGGIIMNRHLSRDNKSRHPRYTSDVFEMAVGIIQQTSVNCVAIQPNNLTELPAFELDFLRELPTTWDEVHFLDGYPSKYVVLARRHGDRWYVGGLNGTQQPMTLKLSLPMLAGKTVRYYTDRPCRKGETVPSSVLKQLRVNKRGEATVTLQPMGGVVLAE